MALELLKLPLRVVTQWLLCFISSRDWNWPEKWHTLSSPPAGHGSWRVPGVCGVRPEARRSEWNIFIIAVVWSGEMDTGIVYLEQSSGVGECEYKGLTQGSCQLAGPNDDDQSVVKPFRFLTVNLSWAVSIDSMQICWTDLIVLVAQTEVLQELMGQPHQLVHPHVFLGIKRNLQ